MDKASGVYSVVVKDVFKTFKLPHEQHSGLKQTILNSFKSKSGYEKQRVLKNISFEIKQGEFFGIVGKNGSGKSTLLKLLAGIYTPDKGQIQIKGELTPFIELGVGFNPELTGRENVYLNGALLGFDRKAMSAMYDDIVNFAEIENFMDQKLKNYSSGMQVRLAFSIAIRANTPVLLIDEVLAVGDSEFQRKCYAEFRKLKESGKTIIFVTHDMSAVERFCDRVLVLQNGEAKGVYSADEAKNFYERMNVGGVSKQKSSSNERWGTGKVKINSIDIISNGRVTNIINQGDEVEIKISFKNKLKENVVVGLGFTDETGLNLSGPNSKNNNFLNVKEISFVIPRVPLLAGEYSINAALFDQNIEEEFDHIKNAAKFTIISSGAQQYGKVDLFGKWK